MIHIKTFVVNCFSENCYLLFDDTNEGVIIDCGTSTADEEKQISTFIFDHKIKLKHHLCTHVHGDHLLGAIFIYNEYGLLPEANENDIQQMPSISEQAKLFGLPVPENDIIFGNRLQAGDKVTFGNSTLYILGVPGHSPGSLSFYDSSTTMVFVGDALFSGSIGRTDFWGGNLKQLIDSIKNQLLTLPDNTIVYPGHGPSTTIKDEKLHNPYLY